jgi:dTDP-4-dehydrorhamnose 3,5-epimerase
MEDSHERVRLPTDELDPMIITPVRDVAGAACLELKLLADERGFFARTFCAQEFREAGLSPVVEQCNMSFNHRAGTLRGMHYQSDPAPEAKLVRCTRGAILDVIVDVRPESDTYLQHFAVELTADNRRALYVPPLCAHGYQTLCDHTEVVYQVSAAYAPGTERGLRYDDPDMGIHWPLAVASLSDKDAGWPLLSEAVGPLS